MNEFMKIKNKSDSKSELYIYGDIVNNTDWKWDESDVMPDDVKNILKEAENASELDIFINSGGGSVFAGVAIANMIKRNKAKKTVYVDGIAASIASVIALGSGAEKVVIPSNAFLMIHKPWSIAMGDSNDFRKMADTLDNLQEGIMNVYKDNLAEGVDVETIKQMVDEETWLNGEEAAKYFNIEVAQEVKAVACVSDYFDKYNKTPQKVVAKDPPKEKPIENVIDLNEWQNEMDLLEL